MNGDKKSLGELIKTMNGAKVDPNVGMWIFDFANNYLQIFSILAVMVTSANATSRRLPAEYSSVVKMAGSFDKSVTLASHRPSPY